MQSYSPYRTVIEFINKIGDLPLDDPRRATAATIRLVN